MPSKAEYIVFRDIVERHSGGNATILTMRTDQKWRVSSVRTD